MAQDKTTLAESAQAIFCSLADYLGSAQSDKRLNLKIYPTFKDFLAYSQNKIDLEKALSRVKVDANIKYVYDFLNQKNGWYESSIIIANKLVNDLKNIDPDYKIAKAGIDYFYLRGNLGVMKDIGELWSIATKSNVTKEQEKRIPTFIGFKDINKWNPADIYLANKIGQDEISKELSEAKRNIKSYSFDFLNEKIKKLIDKGALLPLSLKKTKTDAKLVKVNFVEASKDQVLKNVNFVGTTNWQPYKMLDKTPELSFIALKKGGKTETRDIKIILTAEGKQGEIKIRHDPSGSSSTGRLVIELIMKGDAAKGGSIASQIALSDLWKTIDQKAANDFLQAYNKGVKEFSKLKKEYLKVKDKLRSDKNPSKGDANKYDHYLAIASATNIINEIMPIIKKWFNSNDQGEKGKSNKLIRLLFQIATSRSPLSSRFVIAK